MIGPCEWCGGPQSWTVIAGVVYESCDSGCMPLPLEGLVPPQLPSPESEVDWGDLADGTFLGSEGVTLEGAAADETVEDSDLPF